MASLNKSMLGHVAASMSDRRAVRTGGSCRRRDDHLSRVHHK